MSDPSLADYKHRKAATFRKAGLTNGHAMECTCSVDELGEIHQDAFCPMVHASATEYHIDALDLFGKVD